MLRHATKYGKRPGARNQATAGESATDSKRQAMNAQKEIRDLCTPVLKRHVRYGGGGAEYPVTLNTTFSFLLYNAPIDSAERVDIDERGVRATWGRIARWLPAVNSGRSAQCALSRYCTSFEGAGL